MRVELDRRVRRLAEGRVLLAGSPLRLFRLTEAGARVVDAVERGTPVPPTAGSLVERLLDAGAAHPVLDTSPGESPAIRRARDLVTVVVPALGHVPTGLIEAIGEAASVIVVDDGSPNPLDVAGATVVRHDHNRGPAAARNTGLRRVTTPFVAFVDTDAAPRPGWLDALLPHLDDPRVALVAPRVATPAAPGESALARYEAARSPLDLGAERGRVAPHTRLAYVPAAALVARTAALLAVDGFDETLRTGEDVDLVWRLVSAGWRCRYEPAVVVTHVRRGSLEGVLRQRTAYGASAGPLARRHGSAVAPVVASPSSLVTWGLLATGHPVAAGAVAIGTAARIARTIRLPWQDAVGPALRLAVEGHVSTGLQLASATTRPWWPVAVAAALVSPRARRVVALAAAADVALDAATRRPRLDPLRFAALRLLDGGAYGLGVVAGSIRSRTARPLLPARPPSAVPR